MSDTKPATERQKYLDEKIAEAEGIADKASQTVQERDSAAAQKAEQEKVGTGQDNSSENKRILLEQMAQRVAAYERAGNKAKAAETRARMKELEAM